MYRIYIVADGCILYTHFTVVAPVSVSVVNQSKSIVYICVIDENQSENSCSSNKPFHWCEK